MQEGLYILSGLGSRGLVTAPLCAAMLVAEMTGEISTVDHAIAEALHPARFFIRDLKRAVRRRAAAH
jgi:tRNA 5-methylaminomethyl-2-thiouridine biosynthesis bifunctional protein